MFTVSLKAKIESLFRLNDRAQITYGGEIQTLVSIAYLQTRAAPRFVMAYLLRQRVIDS